MLKLFWKSINIWQNYSQNVPTPFFRHSVHLLAFKKDRYWWIWINSWLLSVFMMTTTNINKSGWIDVVICVSSINQIRPLFFSGLLSGYKSGQMHDAHELLVKALYATREAAKFVLCQRTKYFITLHLHYS